MFPCMKLRLLEELLQDVTDFTKPKINLEQYVTPPHLASHMLYTIQVKLLYLFYYILRFLMNFRLNTEI